MCFILCILTPSNWLCYVLSYNTLGLCLVPGKYKGKKIGRKSGMKGKMKENKKVESHILFLLTTYKQILFILTLDNIKIR